MPSDTVVLAFNHFGESLKYALRLLTQRMTALVHRYTYRASESPRHVVVIGGSYAGLYLAFRLAESLPIGWKVILVEQNSHFNHTFNFPRYSVLQGHEQNAFVPYAGLFSNIPQGVFEQVHNRAVGIEDGLVELASGESIQYEYLAIATGATQSPPSKLLSLEKGDACGEMKALQDKIKEAKTIALVGGGPVGVQLATDIRAFYPEKDITLVHSRAHLLNNFGVRLHDYVMEKLRKSGVKVVLKERPVLPKTVPWEDAKMMFKDGSKHDFDLVVRIPIFFGLQIDQFHRSHAQVNHQTPRCSSTSLRPQFLGRQAESWSSPPSSSLQTRSQTLILEMSSHLAM